jgi:peptidoglycan/LPS O-acetylase OafA/YrhL
MKDAAGVVLSKYRPDVDGLRAVAILSVVLFHTGVPWLSGGFTGVDIFFVISGYLIGGHIHAELVRGTFSYLEFYRRRAKRILPALYVVLAALLVIGFFLFAPLEFRSLSRYAFATTASLSNILLWLKEPYFDTQTETNPLLMTWSLGVEEQFYLVIPLLMVALSRLRQRKAVAAAQSGSGFQCFGHVWRGTGAGFVHDDYGRHAVSGAGGASFRDRERIAGDNQRKLGQPQVAVVAGCGVHWPYLLLLVSLALATASSSADGGRRQSTSQLGTVRRLRLFWPRSSHLFLCGAAVPHLETRSCPAAVALRYGKHGIAGGQSSHLHDQRRRTAFSGVGFRR